MASPQLAIRFPPDVRSRIEHDAERQGKSLSAWVKEACIMRLDPPIPNTVVDVPPADVITGAEAAQLDSELSAGEHPDVEDVERPTVTADSVPTKQRPLPEGLEAMRVAFGWTRSQIDAMSLDELVKVHDAWVDAGARIEVAPQPQGPCPHQVVIRNLCADCGERIP